MNRLIGNLVACLLLLMTGCGPGTTGTGGGDNVDYVSLAGANPAPVCGAAWAGNLACTSVPASNPAIAGNHPGTLRVQYTSSATNPDYVVVFEANRVKLEGGCPRLSYEGDWGLLGSGISYFIGGYRDARLIEPVLSLATVQSTIGGSAQLQLELRGADGRLLFGPLGLQKTGGPDVALKPCP